MSKVSGGSSPTAPLSAKQSGHSSNNLSKQKKDNTPIAPRATRGNSVAKEQLMQDKKKSEQQKSKLKTDKEQNKSKSIMDKDKERTEKNSKKHFDLSNGLFIEESGESEDEIEVIEEGDDKQITAEFTKESRDTLRRMKMQVMEYVDQVDLAREKSDMHKRAMKIIDYLQAVQHRCTRLPAGTSKEMDGCVSIIRDCLNELETRYQQATIRLQAMEEQCYTERSKNEEETSIGQRGEVIAKTQTRPLRGYAEAVRTATSTLIIQATSERDAEEVENQIKKSIVNHQDGVKKIKKIKQGVKLLCENEQEAAKIKDQLRRDEEASEALQVKTASIRRKKIIIFNVPETATEEHITQRIKSTLGLGRESSEDTVTLHRPVGIRDGRKHQPVLLPEPLADHLLKARSICLGLRECPIKTFIGVTRCHRCLEFDHVAAKCGGTQRCTLCSGDHAYTECTSSRRCCYACSRYNIENIAWLRVPKNTEHAANSSACTVRRVLLRARQLQSERGVATLVTGEDVIKGRVSVVTFGNKDRVEIRSQEALDRRARQDYDRSRYHAPRYK